MAIQDKRGRKQLTLLGCCDKVEIIQESQTLTFHNHKFEAVVSFCKNCGQMKATSHIKEKKDG